MDFRKLTVKTKRILYKIRRAPGALSAKLFAKVPQTKSLMIIQTAALGDAALLLPFVNAAHLRSYDITLVCRKSISGFWQRLLPQIEIIGMEKRAWDLGYHYVAKLFADRKFEAVFSVEGQMEAPFMASFPKTPRKYYLSERLDPYSNLFIFNTVVRVGRDEHVLRRYHRMFSAHFDSFEPLTPHFDFVRDDGYVLIHPGAKWAPRRWSKESYCKLLELLQADGIPVLAIASSSEREYIDYFAANLNVPLEIVNDIDRLLNLIASARVFVGNDSGPAHVANLFGKRTVVLWGPGNFERIHPIGENVTILRKPTPCAPCRQYRGDPLKCSAGENFCLTAITPEEVFVSIKNLISAHTAQPN